MDRTSTRLWSIPWETVIVELWMEQEKKITLSETTQTQKDTYDVYSLICKLSIKYMITNLQSADPKRLDREEGTRGTWISLRGINRIDFYGRTRGGRDMNWRIR